MRRHPRSFFVTRFVRKEGAKGLLITYPWLRESNAQRAVAAIRAEHLAPPDVQLTHCTFALSHFCLWLLRHSYSPAINVAQNAT